MWVMDMDNGGGLLCVGAGDIWDIAVPFPQFCCEYKNNLTHVKLKEYFKIPKYI